MDFLFYLEQLVILLLFVLSVRYLISVFTPAKEGGCAKGCGKKCAVANLEVAMEQAVKDGFK